MSLIKNLTNSKIRIDKYTKILKLYPLSSPLTKLNESLSFGWLDKGFYGNAFSSVLNSLKKIKLHFEFATILNMS